MTTSPIIVGSKPGVKRDGTQFEGEFYTDALWCRWQRGLPRKVGGYRQITGTLTGPPRELEIYSANNLNYVMNGYGAGCEQFTVDAGLNASVISNRTPAGFTADPNNDWQFCEVFDTASFTLQIIGIATPCLMDIASTFQSPIYVGDAYGTAALAVAGAPPPTANPSGGIFGLQSYVIYLGSDGLVGWSVSNAPGDYAGAGSGAARVTDQKLICGRPIRGSGGAAVALLWSLNALVRMTFIGGSAVWGFDTITEESSIMSANTVIEYDGIFYWMGVDRFLMFNGVLQELDNDLNLNYLFDNMNFAVRGKAFAFKVPRYGEIWFCVPLFGSAEPNWAIIYNVRESRRAGYPVWYDTPLPRDLRGAAHYAQINRQPFMTGATVIAPNGGYALWAHETGVDEIIGAQVNAVQSYFETAELSQLIGQKPTSQALVVEMIEPDFVQLGPIRAQITGRQNARAPYVVSGPRDFPAVAVNSQDQVVYFRELRRQLRFRFESNVAGGDYQMGQVIAHVGPADARVLG